MAATLTTSSGKWSTCLLSGITYSYQWVVNGQPVAGAVSPSYVVRPADEGFAVHATVTALDAYNSASVDSDTFALVGDNVPVNELAAFEQRLIDGAVDLWVPCELTMGGAVDAIVERGVDAIAAGLAIVAPPGLVYAVGIMSTGEEELDPGFPVIGLERDRQAALLEQTPYEAFHRVWNASDYATEASPVPDLRFDPDFLRLQEDARETLRARGIWDPQRYVLNRIARRLGQRPAPWPVTHDFVVFSLPAEGLGDDLLENLRFSARPEAAAKLVQRGLLPADIRELSGFPWPPVV